MKDYKIAYTVRIKTGNIQIMRNILSKHFILLTLILLFCQDINAETVFMCEGEGEGGSILFSDKPCNSDNGQILHFPDVYTTGEGLSELEHQQLEEINKKEFEQAQQNRETIKLQPPAEDPETASSQNITIDNQACTKAQSSLKDWHRIMSLGYLPEQESTMNTELNNRIKIRNDECGN